MHIHIYVSMYQACPTLAVSVPPPRSAITVTGGGVTNRMCIYNKLGVIEGTKRALSASATVSNSTSRAMLQ